MAIWRSRNIIGNRESQILHECVCVWIRTGDAKSEGWWKKRGKI